MPGFKKVLATRAYTLRFKPLEFTYDVKLKLNLKMAITLILIL
jgi:hypothetical protein